MKSDAFYFGNGPEETERYKRPLDIPLSGMSSGRLYLTVLMF